ncbi:alpha/beta hydrolase [Solwaraspora sp. WMMD1047]|uniref:alpha/beta hydrolase n=1 Tax=Solwaraspora sp. WMMD1047 TaxID=3016102 RepID=UPI00241772F9|nr:alpha/beta hydrolase [Solwaraspora sp. WMMD1047]MDG4831832.1 alpha/beta hydrolase [Solwaraspora sp. WMMD1047]
MSRRRTRLAGRGATVLLVLVGLVGPAAARAAAGTGAARADIGSSTYTATDTAAGTEVAAAMRAAGGPYADWVADGRRFLAFDPRGDGRAVEALGDPDTADRIVILVPGVASRLRDFDRGLGGVRRRAPAAQARALHRQLRIADPGARVAVLAWLGYDPPDGIGWSAARSDSARTGSEELVDLVWTLAAARPAAAITVVGHSYGAVVVGLAAGRLPCQVTDLVSLGGVGMGAAEVAGLGSPARVWAAQAADDWIRWLPPVRLFGLGHGVRPADPAFGARPLPTGAGAGHDDYLVPGSPTLDALAGVVLRSARP